MDRIIDFIKQTEVIVGLFFIVIGVVVGVFKQYWLIAGLNTKSSKELAKIGLDYVTKYFGLFFGILGLLLMLSPIFFDYFDVTREERNKILPIVIISFAAFLILYFNVIKRKKVNNKNECYCSNN